MSLVFDTLKLSKSLGRAFTPEQAEALTEALSVNVNEALATKADLAILQAELKADISDLETRLAGSIAALDAKLTGDNAALDTKLTGSIAALDTKLTGSIAVLDTKLTAKIAALETALANTKADLVRWIVTSLAANTVAMIAIAFTVAKFVAPR